MAMLFSRSCPGVEFTQVWHQLDADRRQQAVLVVVQMAFNLIQTQTVSLPQEEDHHDHVPTLE